MLMSIPLILLYVLQLVFVVKRWIIETIIMIDDARQVRVRHAIDWKTPAGRRL
jgi:hypothetical protein